MKYGVSKAVWFAAFVGTVSLASYFGWFWITQGLPLSRSTSDWGQFGSYMAGTAGVAFALSTVWMLAETLRLQQAELKNSRIEMEKSSNALQQQVELAKHAKSTDQIFYIVQAVDKNISEICNQPMHYSSNSPMVWAWGTKKYKIPQDQPQIKAITSQYMHLMYTATSPEYQQLTNEILQLAQPMIYKYREVLTRAMDAGYFEQYEEPHKGHAKAQLYFENLEFINDIEN